MNNNNKEISEEIAEQLDSTITILSSSFKIFAERQDLLDNIAMFTSKLVQAFSSAGFTRAEAIELCSQYAQMGKK